MFLVPGILTRAQDIHFSQYKNSPVMINPAQTGFFNGAHRFIANTRSQWGSVTVPYKTFSFSYDMQPAYRLIKKDMLGLGFWFYGDKAGDSYYGTVQASLSLSYIFSLNSNDNNHLGFGFMGSWAQRSMSYNNLYFDEQFNGEFYDPSLYSGEATGAASYGFFDFDVGLHWRYKPDKNQFYNAGFSFSHLTRPPQSFLGDGQTPLPVKSILYANACIPFNMEQAVVPGFMMAFQGTASEIVVGMDYKHTLSSNRYSYTAISPGVYYRIGDAVILSTYLDYQSWRFGLSYDVNTSDLSVASRGRGGLELSVIYTLPRTDIHRREEIPCPIF